MIESTIQTKVSPQRVWHSWSQTHGMEKGFAPNQKGALKTHGGSKFSYRILDVHEGESFTILWKSLFVRLIFIHKVTPQAGGSEISYRVQICGFFAWPVRFFLGEKIRRNLSSVLKSLVYQLERS
jgi:hypothetical protein